MTTFALLAAGTALAVAAHFAPMTNGHETSPAMPPPGDPAADDDDAWECCPSCAGRGIAASSGDTTPTP